MIGSVLNVPQALFLKIFFKSLHKNPGWGYHNLHEYSICLCILWLWINGCGKYLLIFLCLYLGYHINIFKTMKICILWRTGQEGPSGHSCALLAQKCFLLSSPTVLWFPFRNHASWTLKLYVLCRAAHIHTYGYIHKYTHPFGKVTCPRPGQSTFSRWHKLSPYIQSPE